MLSDDIKIGDVVIIRGQVVPMTVVLDGGLLKCVWFNANLDLCEAYLPAYMLAQCPADLIGERRLHGFVGEGDPAK